MSRRVWNTHWILALALTVGLGLVAPTAAEAGCLLEYDACAGCAQDTMREAILDADLLGVRRANLELWDCAIDLSHCVFYGDHHSYPCAL